MPAHLQKDLEKLKKIILEMGTIIEESISLAITALSTNDRTIAEQVIAEDADVDQREVHIEEECLKILALHQPVARDLRFVVAVLKMNNDLERIGDFAVNTAERVIFLSERGPVPVPKGLNAMAQKAAQMVRQCLDALIESDVKLAKSVILSDDDVDEQRDRLFTIVLNEIRRDPEHLDQWIQILSCIRYLERIADLSTNIAQDVVYLVEGEVVRHRELSVEADPRRHSGGGPKPHP
ncbi:MAG TPA: phosphate signaling complex protein PhoU [bacterium]|jgi:phosphate transport system protein